MAAPGGKGARTSPTVPAEAAPAEGTAPLGSVKERKDRRTGCLEHKSCCLLASLSLPSSAP